jgi:hypothetical protein
MADSIDSKNISTTAENKAGIQALLRQGAATIVFTKKDGSERVMKCTLQEGVVVPHEKTTDRVKEPKDDILPVWDLEANAWRSITIPNIKTVEFIVP